MYNITIFIYIVHYLNLLENCNVEWLNYKSLVFWFRYHIAGLESVDPNAKRVKLNSLDGYTITGKMVTKKIAKYLSYLTQYHIN